MLLTILQERYTVNADGTGYVTLIDLHTQGLLTWDLDQAKVQL